MHLVESRALPGGGFPPRRGEAFRVDATAWGILTVQAVDPLHPLLNRARSRLAECQSDDGSVSITRGHAEAYWPTAVSVLAWKNSPSHKANWQRGVQFILESTGRHWKNVPDEPIQHDASIPGWPWIADTHSWVEPTALAVCALRSAGLSQHKRVSDGVRLLMNRQLPTGGWNYGNTKVFEKELHPAPESTGVALQALVGFVDEKEVGRSLDYLLAEVKRAYTPIALGWGLLGLAAWGRAPKESEDLVYDVLQRQDRYGQYDTPSLALLLLPLVAPKGLLDGRDEQPSPSQFR